MALIGDCFGLALEIVFLWHPASSSGARGPISLRFLWSGLPAAPFVQVPSALFRNLISVRTGIYPNMFYHGETFVPILQAPINRILVFLVTFSPAQFHAPVKLPFLQTANTWPSRNPGTRCRRHPGIAPRLHGRTMHEQKSTAIRTVVGTFIVSSSGRRCNAWILSKSFTVRQNPSHHPKYALACP